MCLPIYAQHSTKSEFSETLLHDAMKGYDHLITLKCTPNTYTVTPRPESLIADIICHKFIAGKFYLLTISDREYPVIKPYLNVIITIIYHSFE